MVEEALVASRFGELAKFARLLEGSELQPRGLVYAVFSDTEDERLLIVPRDRLFDARELYRCMSIMMAERRNEYPSIDISDIRIVSEADPYIATLAKLCHVDEFSEVQFTKSMFDGIYVEKAIVFKLAL